jgi:outer membrane receptor protein involved in Fe transport
MVDHTSTGARPAARRLLLGALIAELLCAGQGASAQVTAPAAPATAGSPAPKASTETAKTAAAPAKPASAQPAPPAPPASTDGEMASVSVVAERPTNRIDRQTYDVKADVSSTNGSAADALGNVPSVAVDPDGTVSLRGNPNVQILIDGKPSAMLQGENRGATLQSIPSEDIESIEVINNPGAQFGNEAGGGPILNIIMKRSRKAGGFGVVNANYGTAGRFNTATSGTYNSGRFSFQGGVNYRRDGRDSVGETARERINPSSGTVTRSAQDSSSAGLNDSAGLNAGMNYNWGERDTVGANLSYIARSSDQLGGDRYRSFDTDGVTVSDYLRSSERSGTNHSYNAGSHWDHKGEEPGETFKLDLRLSSSTNEGENGYSNVYSVRPRNARDSRSAQDNGSSNRIADFSGDYERPGEHGVLKLGFKASDNRSEFDTRYLDYDAVTGEPVLNQMRSNRFALDQGNLALYGSWQMRLGENWGVLGGLRTEYTNLDIDQLTQQINASNRYLSYIPSAFATYRLTDETNLRLSYAHRIRRANAGELNPFVVYRDELNESSGNPKLRPSQTDSFELGLESHLGKLEANLRAYLRRDSDAILWRRSFVNETVLLNRPENAGSGKAGGLEFTVNGRLTPTLSINTSGNLARTEQHQFDPSGADLRRSASSLSARARVNYQLTEADHLQLALNAQGRTLTGQGYREPSSSTNLSLRHNVTPALSLVLNVTDVFNEQQMETVTDTTTLKETSLRRFDGRIVYFGLSWRLGGIGARRAGPRPGA